MWEDRRVGLSDFLILELEANQLPFIPLSLPRQDSFLVLAPLFNHDVFPNVNNGQKPGKRTIFNQV